MVWIRDCYNDQTTKEYNKSKIVSIIVVRNPNGGTPLTYALKIDNFTTFKQNIDDRLNSILEGTIGDKILKIHKENGIAYNNSTNLEKTFLEMFQNCSFSLYRANDALTTWDKLELIPGTTDGLVNPIPCNN